MYRLVLVSSTMVFLSVMSIAVQSALSESYSPDTQEAEQDPFTRPFAQQALIRRRIETP